MKKAAFLSANSINFSQTLWHPRNWSDTIPPQNGYSWFVSEHDDRFGQKRVFHTGHQAGFIAYFEMFPGKDLLVILEKNSDSDIDINQIFKLLSHFGYL